MSLKFLKKIERYIAVIFQNLWKLILNFVDPKRTNLF